MKKQTILVMFLYAVVIISAVAYIIMTSFGLGFPDLTANPFGVWRLLFAIVSLSLSLTLLFLMVWYWSDEVAKRHLNKNLKRMLTNQTISKQPNTELGTNITRLSNKIQQLTASLQKTENAYIHNGQEIVQRERKRIARDLHDTVSQELFAATMIVSGLSQVVGDLDIEQIKHQLVTVEDILQNAQKDLRILLLHLRPTELEGKTLSEGFAMILTELRDKSDMAISYHEDIQGLPKVIEEQLFRIAQEFISNTLKHAKASQLDVYLKQTVNEVQLKMIDNGVGFDVDEVRSLSYGLKNIEDRIEDLAGSVQLISAKGKGVSMDIRVPILEENDDEQD
ncbi:MULTISPECIES: sensor histidine kinase [unclassified Streptococcus]|uniref:sensor histidine kinase n=1 Tax=unclassified Streptococcus TaxID=2608887 RepID=UPI00359D5D9B